MKNKETKCKVIILDTINIGDAIESYDEYRSSNTEKWQTETDDEITDKSMRYQSSKTTDNHSKRENERNRTTTSTLNKKTPEQ